MKKRSNFQVMGRLLSLVRPLGLYMAVAITMGVIGFLCAILITTLGGMAIANFLGFATAIPAKTALVLALVLAVLRGLLRYAEQAYNHFIAFKLLALIRGMVFKKLRQLCPAKLEGRNKGNLISIITADIELLEVFYAHTISPICIAALVSLIMCLLIGSYHPLLGIIALLAYITVGVAVPLIASKLSGDMGERMRSEAGDFSSFVLDSMRGIQESIQYGATASRSDELDKRADSLSQQVERQKMLSGWNSALTNSIILIFDLLQIIAAVVLFQGGSIGFDAVLIAIIATMSSFGPVVALANLGSTLQNTLASGHRVLDILDEEPMVEEVTDKAPLKFSGAEVRHLNFSYGGDDILRDVSMNFEQNKITGICGKSGSGKSTLMKLMMRFWKAQNGSIRFSGREIEDINTADLWSIESYLTQDTHLFHDSIERNLRIAKHDATHEQVVEACMKASIHEFIIGLPNGYDTPIGELGDTLSGGERQRLGLARIFLHGSPLILLDEPTSNLDSLNEAAILKALKESSADKTVVLSSHRLSTLNIADKVYRIESGRVK